MIHYIIVIQRDSGIPLFERNVSKKFHGFRSELISGMLVALRTFTKELTIGELTSFITHDQKVIIAVTKSVITALIMDKEDPEEEWKARAQQIGTRFENKYNLNEWHNITDVFTNFNNEIDILLKDFYWKKYGQPLQFSISFLEGFLIYDKNLMNYFNYLSLDSFNPEELIKKADSFSEKEVQVTQNKKILIFLKQDVKCGGILVLDPRIEQKNLYRYVKTFSFLIKNMYLIYIFQEKLKNEAYSFFDKNEVKNIIENSGTPLLNILETFPAPFQFIETLRRCNLRQIIKFQTQGGMK